jgi:AbrB family looped-hinge helix DNA binding protein
MRLNSEGQVTIPAELRHRHGFAEGDEVDVVDDGESLRS